jgi:DNA-binding XRE family transcriptional regulator
VVRAADALLETCTDRQVAAQLNEMGHRNWKGQAFTHKKVMLIRSAYNLKGRFQRLRERGMMTGDEIAKQLGVCTTTVHQWGRDGLLRRHLYGNDCRCLYEPVGDVVVIKGAGGRYGSRPPAFIAAPSTGQGAI